MRSLAVSIGLPASPLSALTWSAVTSPALFPKLERTYVRTEAISASVIATFGGITELYFFPFTMISPVSPRSWMRMRFSAGPLTHSDSARGGNTLGMPAPLAWWQAKHLDWYSVAEPNVGIIEAAIIAPVASSLFIVYRL